MAAEFKKALAEQEGPDRGSRTSWPSATWASWPPSRPTTRRCLGHGRPRRPTAPRPERVPDRGQGPAPLRPRRRSRRSFYPQIEEPVDFLAVHPLQGRRSKRIAQTPEFAAHRGVPRHATSASGWWPWAACTSWPPSATRPAASTTSSAAAPAARATPARRASTCRCEDDLMRIFGSDRISGLMLKLGHGRGRAHRARDGHAARSSARRSRWRRRTSRSASTSSNTTT